MTSAIDYENPPSNGWTTDDLDALPEDGRRREIIDGVLLLSPSPTNIHQIIAAELYLGLKQGCPHDLSVTQAVQVDLSPIRALVPDVLVTTVEAARRGPSRFRADETVLAVEVVSKTSIAWDRITKPALYASAGIPCYWRVETRGGLAVHTYELYDNVYRATGEHRGQLKVGVPWEIDIDLDGLLPDWFTEQL